MHDYLAAPIASPASWVAPPAETSAERATPGRRDLMSLGLLLVVVLAVLAVNFWSRYNLYRLDIVTFYIPWYEQLGQRLRDFDIPGWMPYAMSGSPFAGDPQSGWGYWPAMVIFTIAPSLSGYLAFVAFHVVLAAAGTYAYARVIGINPFGAFAAGATFTLGNFMERTACCTIHIQVAVWIPAIFLCIELSRRARTRAGRFGWLVAAGIGTGQMIAGWVGQGAYYGCLAVGVYLLYRTLLSQGEFSGLGDRVRALLYSGSVIGIVGAATAAPAVLPRLDAVGRSNLSELYEGVIGPNSGWALRSVPDRTFNDTSARSYLGAVLLTVVTIAFCLCLRRRHALFFALFGIGVMSLIIRGSPLIDLLNLLPRFQNLHSHSPERIYVILYLAPAVLAGWVVHTLVDREWRVTAHLPTTMLSIVLPAIAFVAAVKLIEHDSGIRPSSNLILESTLAIGAVGLALIIHTPWARRLAAVVVILLLLYDPAGELTRYRIVHADRRIRLDARIDNTLTPNGAARWLQDRARSGETFRYFGYDQVLLMSRGAIRTYHVSYSLPEAWAILVNNRGIQFQINDIQGYNPVQQSIYVELMDAINGIGQSYHAANVLASGLNSPLLNQLNVRYIVVPREIPPGRPDLFHLVQRYRTVYADANSRILENPAALPRAWIVHRADQEEEDGDILTRFSLKLADPSQIVLLTDEPPELERSPDPSAESVEITKYGADEIHLRVTANASGMVVLSEIWDPGWTATVDGKKSEIYHANAVFRGIVVTPGTHDIVLTYPATTVRRSLLFYLIPLAGVAAIPLLRGRRGASATGSSAGE
jgi:hypothetical protein